jgi:hypothetical protein
LELEMFQAKVAEKIKTQISLAKLFAENRAFCEIMRNVMVERDRPQMTILERR